MWHHCIVCSSHLGENQDLEEFQIGGRLAFDSKKGRLWVVCPKCERWNLVPLDQRWEAVEALERLYSLTPARCSTPEMGLARLGGGLEIVRIGDPVPGEFAAWRWGSRFGRRKKRLKSSVKKGKLIKLESGTAWAAGLALAPLAPFLAPIALLGGIGYLISRVDSQSSQNGLPRLHLRAGGITPSDIHPGWSIHVQAPDQGIFKGGIVHRLGWREFAGEDAIRLARRTLPLMNRRAPKLSIVSDAVADISTQGGVDGYLTHAAALKPKWVPFRQYPKPILMAMEMALFQAEERRAMEGEIERLARAWQEAEELAEISDNLILPEGWEAFRAQAKAAQEGPPELSGSDVLEE